MSVCDGFMPPKEINTNQPAVKTSTANDKTNYQYNQLDFNSCIRMLGLSSLKPRSDDLEVLIDSNN